MEKCLVCNAEDATVDIGDRDLRNYFAMDNMDVEEKKVCENCSQQFDHIDLLSKEIEMAKQKLLLTFVASKKNKRDDVQASKKRISRKPNNTSFSPDIIYCSIEATGSHETGRRRKPHGCKQCSKAFTRKGELINHLRTHTGERPFICHTCGASFAQKSNLGSHVRHKHLELKAYTCPYGHCNAAFKRRRLLHCHVMSRHTGERPLQCDHCDASFVYPAPYQRHLDSHERIRASLAKPFVCGQCQKGFVTKDNLTKHKFVHTDKKLFECAICSRGFMRRPHIITHIQREHRECQGAPETHVVVNGKNPSLTLS